jgi:hypothetical protein
MDAHTCAAESERTADAMIRELIGQHDRRRSELQLRMSDLPFVIEPERLLRTEHVAVVINSARRISHDQIADRVKNDWLLPKL